MARRDTIDEERWRVLVYKAQTYEGDCVDFVFRDEPSASQFYAESLKRWPDNAVRLERRAMGANRYFAMAGRFGR